MFYQNQLQLVCETFRKCRVYVSFINPNDSLSKYNNFVDEGFMLLFGDKFNKDISFNDFVGGIKPNTLYRMTTSYKLNYTFLLLPKISQDMLLLIGPFSSSLITDEILLEISEKYNIPPQKQKLLKNYCGDAPVFPNSSPIFAMLETFCELIWESKNYSVVELSPELFAENLPINKNSSSEELDDTLVNMGLMEKRYAYENEIIQAVSQGQRHKLDLIIANFETMPFEIRSADPLRNIKNYSIIMNTLLRKAAEKGGVHPIHLDSMSSSFATKIEQMTNPEESRNLMNDMFRSYCRLVRKHSMKDYSSIVQKTIVCINSDLSINLSLSSLSKVLNVSPGYLSTIFKKETGKTVTEYINEMRVNHAKHLLTTTRLQVQTIALYCGIVDVHYFSKVFKKYTGKTPKEYRESEK